MDGTRKRKRSDKGSQFERNISRELSLWLSKGKDDSIFWRSPGSGSWATRKGVSSTVGAGDILTLKPEGEKLLKYTTIELKRGYTAELLKALLSEKSKMDDFLDQVKKAANQANTKIFWLIWKPDRRDALLITNKRYVLPFILEIHHKNLFIYKWDEFLKHYSSEDLGV